MYKGPSPTTLREEFVKFMTVGRVGAEAEVDGEDFTTALL